MKIAASRTGGWLALYAITACSDSGAALNAVDIAAGVAARGKRRSRSARSSERPVASPRRVATVACWALVPVALAAAPRASRPDSPAASRAGSTMPGRIVASVVIFLSRSAQVSFFAGQPSWLASGSGMARTTGLAAIEGACGGTTSLPTPRSRCSQVDESGTQTSGTLVPPLAWPTPSSAPPCCPAMAAATSAVSIEVTSTATHRPPDAGADFAQRSPTACTTGAISGAAATTCRVGSQQPVATPTGGNGTEDSHRRGQGPQTRPRLGLASVPTCHRYPCSGANGHLTMYFRPKLPLKQRAIALSIRSADLAITGRHHGPRLLECMF